MASKRDTAAMRAHRLCASYMRDDGWYDERTMMADYRAGNSARVMQAIRAWNDGLADRMDDWIEEHPDDLEGMFSILADRQERLRELDRMLEGNGNEEAVRGEPSADDRRRSAGPRGGLLSPDNLKRLFPVDHARRLDETDKTIWSDHVGEPRLVLLPAHGLLFETGSCRSEDTKLTPDDIDRIMEANGISVVRDG